MNKNEKKCRKALIKNGMIQIFGVNRVTLKKKDGVLFYVESPEVF